MNVVCIGAGYVGSVTAAAFAAIGHSVTVIDTDPRKIDMIQKGASPVFEPGLSEIIRMCIGKTLRAESGYDKVREADAVFIGVGTPSRSDGSADLTFVKEAAAQIGTHLHSDKYTVIVIKSTVPVGTSDCVGSIVEETSGLQRGKAFDVVSNPEFLREGYALEDVFYPDRIIIGTDSLKAEKTMKQLYAPLLSDPFASNRSEWMPPAAAPRQKPVWLRTSPGSSELIKYASNAFLAVKISYINDIARLCDALGANVAEVAAGMGLDSRIGPRFLQVSSGWSGSCFPKDTAELLLTGQKYGSELLVVHAAVKANERMHLYCVGKLQNRLKTLHGKTVGVLGLTFKPNTDDARKTQASFIIRRLHELGSQIKVHDPQGMEMFRRLNPDLPVAYCSQPEDTAVKADALILLTHWDCYLKMDWEKVMKTMRAPYMLDTRNALPKESLLKWGFVYEGLGV